VDVSLTDIILAAAKRMEDVTVDMDSLRSTVCISAPGQDDIFMQGYEADAFIAEVDKLYEQSGDVTYDEAALCHAEPYCENCWN
jgi:hypothetical protein